MSRCSIISFNFSHLAGSAQDIADQLSKTERHNGSVIYRDDEMDLLKIIIRKNNNSLWLFGHPIPFVRNVMIKHVMEVTKSLVYHFLRIW